MIKYVSPEFCPDDNRAGPMSMKQQEFMFALIRGMFPRITKFSIVYKLEFPDGTRAMHIEVETE